MSRLHKAYRKGNQRICSPEETLELYSPMLPALGITRIANVTGLDRIGIPVVMVCRPNSRSLSVAQGKSLTLTGAKVSGMMEAIESYHGEHITLPLKIATYEELRYTHPLVDPASLNQLSTSYYHPNLQLTWIEGVDLATGKPVWVPYEMVHTNFSLPMPAGTGCFIMSSNGTASGNHILEAISHGICEVVERDATTLWHFLDPSSQKQTRLDLATVDDPECLEILEKYRFAQVAVVVWETTSDIGIPAFLCSIFDEADGSVRTSFTSSGMGCHPNKNIALLRALTEAAQSRLTLISGSRDDNPRQRYERAQDMDSQRRNKFELHNISTMRNFDSVVSYDADTFEEDISWELEQLKAVGHKQIVMVDLTRPEFRIPIVKIIIPGLEGSHKAPGYARGARAKLFMGDRQ